MKSLFSQNLFAITIKESDNSLTYNSLRFNTASSFKKKFFPNKIAFNTKVKMLFSFNYTN